MAYDVRLKTDPDPLPLKPAVLILLHRKRKAMFVSYTSNARGRAAVMASSLRHRAKTGKAHISGMPEGTIKDFAVIADKIDLSPDEADKAIKQLQAKYRRKGFTMFGSPRSAEPKVVLNGKKLSIVDAIEKFKCRQPYQTVYRRLQRGWPARQALGLEERS